MSRIRLEIDRLVLNGFSPQAAKALTVALQSQLSQMLAEQSSQPEWAQSRRTPVLKLGRMPMETGTAGAGKLGRQVAQAVARGLKP